MSKRIMTLLTVCVLYLAAFMVGASAYTTEDLTIPNSAETIVYGQSGAGRNLTAYRFGNGKNVMVVGFAIHGYEDNWARDGGALVYTAGELMRDLDENQDVLYDYDWSVYVLPCMNPDGLIDGYTKDGPGRCTTTYLTRSGQLSDSAGIDMNRSFPVRWTAYSGNRNFNGSYPLASRESAALAEFVKDVRGSGANICIDTHGWFSQIITSNGTSSSLYKIFKEAFPGNTWANCNNGSGYFTAYTASLGYASCLFEFPDGLYSMGAYQNSGYCEKYCESILKLTKAYGSYNGHTSVCPTAKFTDVSPFSWYHTYLDYVVEQGIFNGMSENTFEPETTMSRAMLVTTLWRMAGAPAVEIPAQRPEQQVPDAAGDPDGPYQFSDVPVEEWYTDAVYWAQENGIVLGYPEGDFRPAEDISRQDMALILQRFAAWRGEDVSQTASLSGYTDRGMVGDYAETAVAWACAKGILQGMTETTLEPLGNATRAQVATVLTRYLTGNTSVSTLVQSGTDAYVEPNYYDDGEDLDGN